MRGKNAESGNWDLNAAQGRRVNVMGIQKCFERLFRALLGKIRGNFRLFEIQIFK
jgi:hypothetical protein